MQKLSQKLKKGASSKRKLIRESANMEIEVIAHPEDTDYTDQGYDEGVEEVIRQNVQNYGLWGWCMVEVKASSLKGAVSNSAYLGGCSYQSAEDFKRNSPYFKEMKREATQGLEKAMNELEMELSKRKK